MDKLQDAWDDLFDQEERITEGTGEGSPGSVDGYTSYMKISAGKELPADIILYVRVDGYIPPEPSDRGRSGEAQQPEKQYYWRNATYSTYNGSGWSNYTSREQEYPARSLVYPDSENQLETYDYVTLSVERLNPVDKAVYFTGDLLSVDQPFIVSWRKYDDPIKSTTPADRYTSVSRLPRATIPQLREVGNELPAVIRDRYLQLPADLPNRVRDLALDLTVGMDNSYDRASVIQTYLRQFPYNLDVPAPPVGRDAVDFFLFDLQQGYCNYFASAMTVLARSAGLPARLVTGYRTGGYDYLNQRFIIREQNSHAWVEVYFSGIGWVEFEPTSGVPIFPHPGGTTLALPPATPAPVDTTPALTRFFWSAVHHPLALVSLLAALTLVIFLFPLRDWILYLQPAEKALTTIFKRLYHQGRRWGIPSDASRTPMEFCRLLSSRLEIPARESLSNDLQTLTRLYSLQLFSPMAPVRRDIKQAIGIWIRLRRALRRTPRRNRSRSK
jgi:transglutaminase-like putative cysteine protease